MFQDLINISDWRIGMVLVNPDSTKNYIKFRYGDLDHETHEGVLWDDVLINHIRSVPNTKGKTYEEAVRIIREICENAWYAPDLYAHYTPDLYVAAGYYGEDSDKHFGIVGPGNGRYYVGTSPESLTLCQHHSGLYWLIETGTVVGLDAPKFVMSKPGDAVNLSDQQIHDIQQSMRDGYVLWG